MADGVRWQEALTFLCEFVFKAFGPNEEVFVQDVIAGVAETTPVTPDAVRVRASAAGTYACVSIVVWIVEPGQIEAIYRTLHGTPRLRYLL